MGERATESSSLALQRFERIYRDNFRFVWTAARRLGVPDHGLEDAVQDVFSTTFGKLDEIDTATPIRGWLWGVTRRVAFRHRRTAARVSRRRAAIAQVDATSNDPSARHHAARWVDRFLHTLEPPQRDVFVMAELLGMSAVEIAAEQAVPVNTVYSRLRLARRSLVRLAQSPEHARLLVHAAHRDAEPPPQARARGWTALLPALQGSTGATALATASVAPTTGAWLGVGALTLGAGLFVATAEIHAVPQAGGSVAAPHSRPAPTRPSDPPPHRTTPPRGSHANSGIGLEPDGARWDGAAPRSGSDSDSDAAPRSGSDSDAAPRSGSDSDAAPRSGEAALRSDRAAPGSTGDSTGDAQLGAELRLIEAAQAALNQAQPGAALDLARTHARRYARGQLVDVRMSVVVQALCALGRPREASRVRQALQAKYPGSNVARSEALQCG